MDRRMMVKQYVAVVRGRWCKFMVFQTGDPRFYLFCPLSPEGYLSDFQIPVRKTELRREIASMLNHGCGNANL